MKIDAETEQWNMLKLKTFILTNLESGNRCVYDRVKNSTLLCNPIFHLLLKLEEKDIDIRKWIDRIETFPVELNECGPVTREDLEYYYKKLLFLKENGYFSKPEITKYAPAPIKPETIEYSLANTRQVTFEVTERCQLACKYCGCGHLYKFYGKRKEATLDINKAKKLLTFLVDYWNSSMNISYGKIIYIGIYGGEPLMNVDFIKEIVRFSENLKLLHNHVQFSMTTNALLLEKHMDFLVDKGFNLLISLDGGEKNNSYRVYKNQKPAYHDILRNIIALRHKYPDYFKEKVNFNAVLHDKNSVSEIYAFFRDNFDKIPRIGELKTIGVKDEKQRDFMKMYTGINRSLYTDSIDPAAIKKEMFIKLPDIQNLSNFLFKYSGFVFEDYRHFLSQENNKKPFPTGTCLPFSKKIFVTADGYLLPCETILHKFYLGKVTKEKIELDFSDIAQKYNDYYEKISSQCSRCYNKEACVTCIFNLLAEDDLPVCDQHMDYSRFSRYLASNLYSFEKEPHYYYNIMEDVSID